jgi:hypothetical protein
MSESNAEITLRNAGMIDTGESEWDELDASFSGAPPAVKFATIGDSVTGYVVKGYMRNATVFGGKPGEWKTRDDGSIVRDPVIELRTLEGDLVTLYVSSWRMRNALSQAFQQAGVRGPRSRGMLMVRYCADEPQQGGANPAKVYEAAYDAPSDSVPGPARLTEPESNVGRLAAGSGAPPF